MNDTASHRILKIKIKWQVRQTYRILNTILASQHLSIQHQCLSSFRKKIHSLKIQLENSEELKPLLTDIQLGKLKPNLILAGHGSWNNNGNYVHFPSKESAIVFFTPISATIDETLARDIENKCVDPQSIVIINEDTGKRYLSDCSFKQVFNYASKTSLPNFCISAEDSLPIRLIEDKTGKVLIQSSKDIFLNTLLKLFPEREIYFASCTRLKDAKTQQHLGDFKNYLWTKLSDAEKEIAQSECSQQSYKIFGLFSKHLNTTNQFKSRVDYCENVNKKRRL